MTNRENGCWSYLCCYWIYRSVIKLWEFFSTRRPLTLKIYFSGAELVNSLCSFLHISTSRDNRVISLFQQEWVRCLLPRCWIINISARRRLIKKCLFNSEWFLDLSLGRHELVWFLWEKLLVFHPIVQAEWGD